MLFACFGTLVLVLSVAGAVGILETLFGSYLLKEAPGYVFRAGPRYGLLRAQSVFPHPIVLGTAMVIGLPLALLLARRGAAWAWGAVCVMSLALVLTLSRGPWLGAVVAVVVAGLAGRRKGVRVAVAAVGVAVLLYLGSATVRSLADQLTSPTQGQYSYVNDYRRQLAQATWRRIVANPFSATLDPLKRPSLVAQVNGRAVDVSVSVDNTYARYVLELGAVGALLLLGLIASIVFAIYSGRVDTEVQGSIVGAQVGLLATAITVGTLSFEQIGVLFWLVSGVGLAFIALGTKELRSAPVRLRSLVVEGG